MSTSDRTREDKDFFMISHDVMRTRHSNYNSVNLAATMNIYYKIHIGKIPHHITDSASKNVVKIPLRK